MDTSSMSGSIKGANNQTAKWQRVTDGSVMEGSNLSTMGGTELGDLPESSIASILSLTTPRDVARLASVSRSFWAASESDVVWRMMLPSSYAGVLAQASDAPASTCSKKEVYNFLCNPVLLQNGTQNYWLDRATGGPCQSIGARNLDVNRAADDRYWKWCCKEGSRFAEVACLWHNIVWLKVKGKWQCNLSPGTYTFSWRLHLRGIEQLDRGFIGPLTFSFEASGNEPVETECYLTSIEAATVSQGRQHPLGYRWDRDAWIELDVGEFTVESEDSPFEIEFQLGQIRGVWEKTGICIDGVAIRPSSTIQNRIPLSRLSQPYLNWVPTMEQTLRALSALGTIA